MAYQARKSDPKTKEDFLDRMLRFDFNGDIRNLGVRPASIVRTGANRLEITFPETGVTFEVQVRRPREVSDESRSFAPFGPGEEWTAEPEAPQPKEPERPSRRPPSRTRGRDKRAQSRQGRNV